MRLVKHTLPLVLVFAWASSALAVTTIWDFNGDLTATSGYDVMEFRDAASQGQAFFGTTDGYAVPHMNGQPATYMAFPSWGGETGPGH